MAEEPKERHEVVYMNKNEDEYKDKVLKSEEAADSSFLYVCAFTGDNIYIFHADR